MNIHTPPHVDKASAADDQQIDAKVNATDPDDALLRLDDAPPAPEQPAKSALHQAALDCARRGWPVFPCVPGAKQPATENGFKAATTDTAQIDAWWNKNPEYNVAFEPERAGLAIIDVDPGADMDALASLALPATYEVTTPRGGKHLYYKGSLPPTAGKLAKHVDTRGERSYVLLPPSNVGGNSYTVRDDRTPASLPTAIKEKVTAHVSVSQSSHKELDLPGNISAARARLRDFVRQGFVAIENEGGDNRTYEVACAVVKDYALSVDRALELIEAEWNPHCIPPWDHDELRIKVENAANYAQNESGAYATSAASELFASVRDTGADASLPNEPDRKRHRFLPVDLMALADSEPPTYWDDAGLLVRAPEGAVTVLYGRKGINKTGFMLSTTVNLALHNNDVRVVYFAGEAPDDLARSRIPPACEHFGKSLADLVATRRFALIDRVPQLLDPDQMDDAIDDLRALKPNIVVIDTATRALFGRNLNQTEVMTAAYAAAERIRKTFGALVVIIHHEGKDESKGAKGDSSLEQNADIVLHATSPANGTTCIHVKHSRYGRDGGNVFFKSNFYSKEGRYKDVPVLVQIAGTDAPAIFSSERMADRDFRDRICTALREAGAHDPYTTGLRTRDLARALVNTRWAHVSSLTAQQRREYDTAVQKMIEKLDNGARTNKGKPGKLTNLCERVTPPGTGETGQLTRMWYVPVPLGDDADEEELSE